MSDFFEFLFGLSCVILFLWWVFAFIAPHAVEDKPTSSDRAFIFSFTVLALIAFVILMRGATMIGYDDGKFAGEFNTFARPDYNELVDVDPLGIKRYYVREDSTSEWKLIHTEY